MDSWCNIKSNFQNSIEKKMKILRQIKYKEEMGGNYYGETINNATLYKYTCYITLGFRMNLGV